MKLAIILSRFPYPLEKGDKLRAYYFIKHLSKEHELFLFALSDTKISSKDFEEIKHYCKEIKIVYLSKLQILINLLLAPIRQLPFQVSYFYSKKNQRIFNTFISKIHPDKILCQLIRTTEYVKEIKGIPKTLDYMDAFSKGIERRIAIEPWYLKALLKWEYKKLIAYEHAVFANFQDKLIISEQDRNAINHPKNEEIRVIRNGVNLDFFKEQKKEKKYDILFAGNMQYPPNVESAEFLVTKILPILKKQLPNIKIVLAGSSPTKRVLALASKNVTVTGWIEDIRDCYAESKILVAPMQISIGLQNKLLEAMAMKIPCVTSFQANNALQAIEKKEILLAETPEQFADAIVLLLTNNQLYASIQENGYTFVKNKYDWEKSVKQVF
ncbi:MAG: glycosyltransferase [Bacteroidetes bacterium]|nr:glycosyltransferase [Bacteroidota bacterium]